MAPPPNEKDKPTADPNSSAPIPPTPITDNFTLKNGINIQVNKFWGELVDQTGARHSRFLGESDEISFVSFSNIRIYKESRESVISKVSYALEDDDVSVAEVNAVIAKLVDEGLLAMADGHVVALPTPSNFDAWRDAGLTDIEHSDPESATPPVGALECAEGAA